MNNYDDGDGYTSGEEEEEEEEKEAILSTANKETSFFLESLPEQCSVLLQCLEPEQIIKLETTLNKSRNKKKAFGTFFQKWLDDEDNYNTAVRHWKDVYCTTYADGEKPNDAEIKSLTDGIFRDLNALKNGEIIFFFSEDVSVEYAGFSFNIEEETPPPTKSTNEKKEDTGSAVSELKKRFRGLSLGVGDR